jgi:ATP-dependent Lon protease
MTAGPLKIFYLKKKVLFPHCTVSVRMRESKHTLSLAQGDQIIVYSLRNILDILFVKRRVSTLAEIISAEKEDNTLRFQLKGIKRVRVTSLTRFFAAQYAEIPENTAQHDTALTKELRKKAQELIFLINVEESDRLIDLMNFLVDLGQITDFISNYFVLDDSMRNDLLNETDISARSRLLQQKIQQIIEKIGKQG